MEEEYIKINDAFHNDMEKCVKNFNEKMKKFIENFAKKNWEKISLEIPKNFAKIVGTNEDNKVEAYIIPTEVLSFDEEMQKNYLLMGENGIFLWETITDIHGNVTGTHINLADGFPDYLDRYFRKLYLMKN